MHSDLKNRVLFVAFQCRRMQWSRCWIRFGLANLVLILAFTLLLNVVSQANVSRNAVIALFFLLDLGLVWWLLLRPLRSPITLQQVAMYIDEHHPELQNRILSSLEFSGNEYRPESQWMVEQFLKDTESLADRSLFWSIVDSDDILKPMLGAAIILAISLCIPLASFRLWLPSFHSESTGLIAFLGEPGFTVQPGNARVRRGDSQAVFVKSSSVRKKVSIHWRSGDRPWQEAAMRQGDSEDVHYHQFLNLQADHLYEIQFGRGRSERYRFTVWTPPDVDAIDLTYTYPDYLGLEQRTVPNSGNIAAVVGTVVDIAVWVNKELASAELVYEEGERLPLAERMDTLWGTSIEVRENAKYHIELHDNEGESRQFNPIYEIAAQADLPPVVQLNFPRGDLEATVLDEVPFELHVQDDFGIRAFGIQYEVAGREPVRITTQNSDETSLEADGEHLLMLESLNLQPGDLITWSSWAQDFKLDREPYEELADPYFIEIRPFRRSFEEAISNNSGGEQGQGQSGESADQKAIIIATWKLRQQAKDLSDSDFKEKRSWIVDAQTDLLGQHLESGGPALDRDVSLLIQEMADAVDALKSAGLPEPVPQLSEALLHEQKAYQILLRMEPERRQVTQSQSRNGGQGGSGQENRPELDELELNRNRNFYEQESRAQAQQEATEEALNRIQELAERQGMSNDELSKLISEFEDEKDEEARRELQRRLEKLEDEARDNLQRLDEIESRLASGEMNDRQVQEALRGLNETREQMNRSLENSEQGELQRARAAGTRALTSLDEIQEQLQQLSGGSAAREMDDLQQQMQELVDTQRSIVEELRDVQERQEGPSLSLDDVEDESKAAILQRKQELGQSFLDAMNHAADLASRTRESQALLSRKLNDWLRDTGKSGILEDIEKEGDEPFIRYGIWDSAITLEESVLDRLVRASEQLEGISGNIVDGDLDSLQRALAHLDELLDPRQALPESSESRAADTDAEGGERTPSDETASTPAEGQSPGGSQAGSDSPQPRNEDDTGQDQERPGGAQASGQAQDSSEQSSPDGRSRPRTPGARAQPGGRAGGGTGPLSDADMRRFIEEDYSDWTDSIRSAESLIPDNDDLRQQLARVRSELDEMRRDYRRQSLPPKYDLYIEAVARPLQATADQIQTKIQELLKEKELLAVGDDDVPADFEESVASYFKALSDSEGE